MVGSAKVFLEKNILIGFTGIIILIIFTSIINRIIADSGVTGIPLTVLILIPVFVGIAALLLIFKQIKE